MGSDKLGESCNNHTRDKTKDGAKVWFPSLDNLNIVSIEDDEEWIREREDTD